MLYSQNCLGVYSTRASLDNREGPKFNDLLPFPDTFVKGLGSSCEETRIRKAIVQKSTSFDFGNALKFQTSDALIGTVLTAMPYCYFNENENSFRLPDNSEDTKMFSQFKSENSYLNALLGQDSTMKRRLARSTGSRRKSKDLNLGR